MAPNAREASFASLGFIPGCMPIIIIYALSVQP
jgi:hypothetical protein